MKKKNLYVSPEIEVVIFSVEDIVTTSEGATITSEGIELPDHEW